MEKKLPKVFANKITKKIKNNNEIYVSNKIEEQEESKTQNKKTGETKKIQPINRTISQKIDEIINTKKYIYRIPVKIKLKDKEIITNIIGRNNTNIITMENELIKIKNIENIELNEKNE